MTMPTTGATFAAARYQIVRQLGEGGMGVVYQARQLAMDRMVALKVIRDDVVHGENAKKRFEAEMRATARVEHPNTVRVYDFGEAEGRLYLAMEYLTGEPLGPVIEKSGKLELARIVHIGAQIAKALGAAHERGIVHRDLKPDNVMLIESFGVRDFVKVLDFGIAKSLDETTAPMLTQPGMPIGTPAYMAPEQALGRPVDRRTDLYALGVILYEMASGRIPFVATTSGAVLIAHATDAPPPLEADVPADLAALVMQLLEKDPAARPQSAAEVVERLEACGRGAPPPRRRRRLWPLAVAGAVVLAGGGTALALLLGGTPAAACDAAALAAARAETDPPRALAAAEALVKACPTNAEALDVDGNALQRLGRLDEAEDAYVRALAAAPGYDAPRFNLGLLQLRRKDASAVATFTELLRRRPDHPNAHLARAQAYLLQHRDQDALADLEAEVAAQPKNATAWRALGQLREHLGTGDWKDAYCKARAFGDVAAPCP